jgi:Replication factor-A protein 1, N-terminal domain
VETFSFEFGSDIHIPILTDIGRQGPALNTVPRAPSSKPHVSIKIVDKDIAAYKRVIWHNSEKYVLLLTVFRGIQSLTAIISRSDNGDYTQEGEQLRPLEDKRPARRPRGVPARPKPGLRAQKSDREVPERRTTEAPLFQALPKPLTAGVLTTRGVLKAIFNDPSQHQKDFHVPGCQLAQMKRLNTDDAPWVCQAECYRLGLSDIHHFAQCLLVASQNHLVHEGKLKIGSILRLRVYHVESIRGKSFLILVDAEVIEGLGELTTIGNPLALPDVKKGDDANLASELISVWNFQESKGRQTHSAVPQARYGDRKFSVPRKSKLEIQFIQLRPLPRLLDTELWDESTSEKIPFTVVCKMPYQEKE